MHENNELKSSNQRVLIYPAQISKVSGKQVYFLFSLPQVEDILIDDTVMPDPFSPSFVDGVVEWRSCKVPVVSLEAFWTSNIFITQKTSQLMVVRIPQKKEALSGPERIMLRMTPPVRMLSLPIDCTPLTHKWISDNLQTKGIYDWENGILIVADIAKILDNYHWNPQKGR